ncbi:hypothetical protein [Planococcus sp. ISL-109]|uniref:hypothetical protein n=1 Tax=Planococcus sp. ISL-109 TaxID=2819166 RepID=UPI001BEBAA70|nr:hypothetical protein [Planococcus sp. ISL-109]MBT2582807.1 hypothetical protein [Planococcus sp. ISL-109]
MVFLILWLLLISYAVFVAPAGSGGIEFGALLMGDWEGVDPLILAVFNSLGIFPLVFLTLLVPNDRFRWPAWPFALLSFGVGAFSLLPYFAFGAKPPERKRRGPEKLHRLLRSKAWLLFVAAISIINFLTVLRGFSLDAYGEAFRTSSLVSVMTVDWLVLWGLSVYAIYRFEPDAQFKQLALLPVVGPVLVLLLNRGKTGSVSEQ